MVARRARVVLEGQTILITGASSGLGRALALALSKRSNRIVITARREALLRELAAEIEANGSPCLPVVADATDPADAQRVLDAATEAWGSIDTAFLNAGGGTGLQMGSEAASVDAVLAEMARNYSTLVNFLVPLLPLLQQRGGTLVWTGSPAGVFGLPRSGPYSAAKAAGRLLIDSCRIDLAHTPIRFVSVYPGFTYTDGLDPDQVPSRHLIIQPERAVAEIVAAAEAGRAHHTFPKRLAWPLALAAWLPEPVRRWLLGLFSRPG